MTLSREFSEDVSPWAEAVVATPKSRKTVRKTTRTFLVLNIRGSVEKVSAPAYPPKGGGGPRFSSQRASARSLGEADPGQGQGRAAELNPVERLSEPGPGDEDRNDRLEHRHDCRPGSSDPRQRGDDERERDDRAEHDHPRDQEPEGRVQRAQVTEQRRA